MQATLTRRSLVVKASAAQGPKLVSPVTASRRNAMLGFAGACAGLLVPFTASAAATTTTGPVVDGRGPGPHPTDVLTPDGRGPGPHPTDVLTPDGKGTGGKTTAVLTPDGRGTGPKSS